MKTTFINAKMIYLWVPIIFILASIVFRIIVNLLVNDSKETIHDKILTALSFSADLLFLAITTIGIYLLTSNPGSSKSSNELQVLVCLYVSSIPFGLLIMLLSVIGGKSQPVKIKMLITIINNIISFIYLYLAVQTIISLNG